ncbi:MAG TPA: amidohydrolase [Candidatus Polarisedimenticolaceae bacterium]|nr:amidohydrolase [Candidatus Polarisedimenticolaceae bacterium]
MTDALKRRVGELEPAIVGWRRDLHRCPELGFEEHETGRYVARCLRGFDLAVRTGVAKTGIVAVLKAKAPSARPVLLRADMDALPIEETAGRPYGSSQPGKMHACGHDGHMAMLLGAAAVLAAERERLTRDVVFCFQPGEEGFGGAEAMIREGILDEHGVAEAYGLHLWSQFPVGTIQVRPGPTMAAQDEFEATLRGHGGHGALPHKAIDPIVAAASAILSLQTVVSRSVDPVQPAVVTVGALHAGTAANVIPDTASMNGTLRSFESGVRETLRRRVKEILEGAARAGGCTLEYTLHEGYPAVVNDPAAVERVRRHASAVVGHGKVIEPDPMAAAEDFAYFLERVPGAFTFIGAGNAEAGITAPHHSPRFDIDEAALPIGTELLARIALGE